MSFTVQFVDTRQPLLSIQEFEITNSEESASIELQKVLSQIGLTNLEIDQLFSIKGQIGVFGVVLLRDSPVYPKDRIEIYSPIRIDPKNARRKKANQNKDAQLKAKAKLRSEERGTR